MPATDTSVIATEELAAAHRMGAEEFRLACEKLGRAPNLTELGIISVMWSEHCSYKSSRVWLKKLPTTGPHVICGPGENAGVIDIGDGQAIIFKMESHNHPSFIEPYQGAATGVGGIMRDVFTMGARPIALLNALRFGEPDHSKTRHLVAGVVAGIGDYGNCMGVPTVGGETNFDARYNGNILVNAMCVGLADANRIFYSAAAGAGNPVVYVGSKTGRDGIHGATMASAEFDDNSQEQRPTVQVGDPFAEKLLLEACLELMAEDAILAIQDMGAAGLTSSSVEMAAKGGSGIELNLDLVPQREEGMTAYEMMLSESQERMLMVLRPGSEPLAERIFRKWELDFAVIGTTTDTGHLVLRHKGALVADLPTGILADEAPMYNRPIAPKPVPAVVAAEDVPAPNSLGDALTALIGSPHLASRRWIWEQYDHMVMDDTVVRPGSDAAVVRIHGTNKAVALTTDVTPRYCYADPFEGGKQAVAETWRNITAAGGKPLAITDCMNFGNPERPEIMAEFARAIEGMGEACRALEYPVVSGNVSLYNETNGEGILPTPAIGGVGLIADVSRVATVALKPGDDVVVLIGAETGHLGQSLYQDYATGRVEGAPPPVDLAAEKKAGDFVRRLIEAGVTGTVHDISDGGTLVALAEMAIAGKRGLTYAPADGLAPHAAAFGEEQGRYLVGVSRDAATRVLDEAKAGGIPARIVGEVGGDVIAIDGEKPVPVGELRRAHEDWFPTFMGGKR
ncbi:phosphoribosylformylglycinamidine synthase II [Rhodomicrobium vannielii ATCC 17100]|uniref:Phosphoribosylformylglycinamidine synthase subunit PurL n=1 Tax=Rhodomicrobium vannielii (strain ATCC 17100 / DSM 162 / LMG 4299 / NCIMB 10020 / ATH 3.1.1) TaxID=648757 RepID=E3I896_RHOVT|nr:phosphoribosylformylglycinamidine synthase subunit PurL [Rhodomicrobium vannielii]ADP69721.1 phosphoribosylformylglycinamidine synthase II [Rhodomicrobium vannielii ATCC 17100]